MAKAIFLFILLLATVGCTEYITQEQYMEHQNRKFASHIEKFQYEGHSYIILCWGNSAYSGLEHDPNCPCFKNVEKE